jgi:predicted dehydrogenase
MKKTGIGIIGCGNISAIYLKNCSTLFDNIEVRAVADLDRSRAEARAAEFKVPSVLSVEELLASSEIDIVLNLTVPNAHHDVCLAALKAGKHVYVEKPLSVCLADGVELSALAKSKGLRIGGAPDTFLGGGIQTCASLINSGWIGEPVGASAFMVCGGHEGWHPDPEFYYQRGGGPLFDMGPYYLTALVALLGPLAAVSGLAKASYPQRTIGSQPKRGKIIDVEVPTHVSALLEFASGAHGTLVTSFDAPGSTGHAPIEIYGSEGTLRVPDPNTFGGPIHIRRAGASEWSEIPLRYPFAENSRGLGLSDMARGISQGQRHRASGELTLHVLEAMEGIHVSASQGRRYAMTQLAEKPELLAAR